MVHRDLKPSNLLIARSGEVKLADFGTARILSEPALGRDEVYDAPVGDLAYAPIEIYCGMGRYPESLVAADFFSLGTILFEMFTQQVLTDLVFDRQIMLNLITVFSTVQESHRVATLDMLLGGFQGRLPELRSSPLVPPAIGELVERLYKHLADLDYRRRAKLGFEWIFGRILTCSKILEHEKKYQHMLEERRKRKENREQRETEIAAKWRV